MALEERVRHLAKRVTETLDEGVDVPVEGLGRVRRGLEHQREPRRLEHRQEGREDDVPDLAFDPQLVEEPVSHRPHDQRDLRPLRQAGVASLGVDGQCMVFVPARKPPREAHPGVQPHDSGFGHPLHPHRAGQLALHHPAERLCVLGADVSVREGDDLPALEEADGVLSQILALHRTERLEPGVVGPVRLDQQRAHLAHRTSIGLALAGVAKVAGVLGLLRFEAPRRERQRAQGRHDAREQEILLVAPTGETHGDPPTVSRQRPGLPGERGRIREFVEHVMHHPDQQCAQHRMAGRVVGDRRAKRDVEVRPRPAELDVGAMPQIEAGPARDPGRPRPGRRLVDQRQAPGQEGIGLREQEGAVRGRVAPARHASGRDGAQAVRRLVKGCHGVGRHALRDHAHEHALRGERAEAAPHELGVEVVEAPGRAQDLPDRMVVQGGGEKDRV